MVLKELSPLDRILEETVFSTTAIIAVFVIAYIPLLVYMGYSYPLHIASTMAFSIIGIAVVLLMFRENNHTGNRVKLILVSMVLLITIEELLLNSPYAVYGLSLAIMGFVLVPVIGLKLGENEWIRTALDAVALIFATRVVLSPFPVGYFKTSVFLPLIYTLILASIVVYLTLRNIPSEMIRLKIGNTNIRKQAVTGLILGASIGVVEYMIIKPQPVLETSGFMRAFFYTLTVMAVMVGIAEEVLFRGLLQTSLEKEIPRWQAVGVSAILFGLMHVGWMNPLEVILAYGAGVVFGYLAIHMESLVAPIVAHGFGNLMLYMIPIILLNLR